MSRELPHGPGAPLAVDAGEGVLSSIAPSPRLPADPSEARVAPLLLFGYRAAAGSALALLILHFGHALLLDGRHAWAFDANEEGTPFTWLSVVACSTTGVAALLAVFGTRCSRTPAIGLAAASAFLSLDDAIGVHERIAEKAYRALGLAREWDSVIWPALYIPLLVVTAGLILHITRAGSAQTLRSAVTGLALLGAAIVAEVVSAPWSTGRNTVHLIQGGIEEALELAGWILIACGVMASVLMQMLREARSGR